HKNNSRYNTPSTLNDRVLKNINSHYLTTYRYTCKLYLYNYNRTTKVNKTNQVVLHVRTFIICKLALPTLILKIFC
uniref:Uncharacterized protein n=1 Tax=Ciona intestinalis TaxID=7719 RepID=H2XKS1_CIOIN